VPGTAMDGSGPGIRTKACQDLIFLKEIKTNGYNFKDGPGINTRITLPLS
jgi:hypothetical protein